MAIFLISLINNALIKRLDRAATSSRGEWGTGDWGGTEDQRFKNIDKLSLSVCEWNNYTKQTSLIIE